MLSIVVFTLWHGEGTDPLYQFIEEAQNQGYEIPELRVMEYTMRVDCDDAKVNPDAITAMLDACNPWNTTPIDYSEGMTPSEIAQELIDMGAFEAWHDDVVILPEFYNRVMREAANA